MRRALIIGILMSGMAGMSPSMAQNNSDELAQLRQRVAQLEKQVQEILRLLEPVKNQQTMETRRKIFRQQFDKKMLRDRQKYTPEQLDEAESLYQVANKKWGSPEAAESLQKMIQKYPDINRTGCAVLYVAQRSQGEERARRLQECIQKFNDCFYGDGVQVGVYARFLLAQDYHTNGDEKKAEALFNEIKANYSDAVDHGGRLLVDTIKAESK